MTATDESEYKSRFERLRVGLKQIPLVLSDAFQIFLKFVLAVLVIAALLFVGIWLIESLYLPSQASVQQTIDDVFLKDGQSIQIDFPSIILVAEKPAEITITREYTLTSTFPSTRTLSVLIPHGLLLAFPPDQAGASAASVLFPPMTTTVQTVRLGISNARSFSGLFESRQITITLPDGEERILPVQVEGIQQATLRSFVNGSAGDRSSILVFMTAISSAVALLLTKGLERTKLALEIEEKNKSTALDLRKQLVACLQSQQIAEASHVLNEMRKDDLHRHIPQAEMHLATELLSIANGPLPDVQFNLLERPWLNAAGSLLIYAVSNNPPDRNALRRILRSFPADLLDSDLRTRFADAQSRLDADPLQPLHWLIYPSQANKNELSLRGNIGNRIGNVNPFPYGQTENELTLLFGGKYPALWMDHPQYTKWLNTGSPTLILGPTGTGKTAMAMALGEYPADSETVFAMCLTGLPQVSDIQAECAVKLLRFVRGHPTWLGLLGQSQRDLLAQLFAVYPGTSVTLAEIDAEIDSGLRRHWEWLKEARDENVQELWQVDALTQLKMLRQTIATQDRQTMLTTNQWIAALVNCSRYLRFNRARLVVDTKEQLWNKWLKDTILPNLQSWTVAGLNVMVFVRVGLHAGFTPPRDLIEVVKLEWEKTDLEQMVEWRYTQIAAQFRVNLAFKALFEDNALPLMIDVAEGNPARLIRIWNKIVSIDSDDGSITEALVRKAKGQI